MKILITIWLSLSVVTTLPCVLMAGKFDEKDEN